MLIAGATLTVASHTLWLPFWVDVIAAALLIWRAFVSIRNGALPARWLLIALTLAGAMGVFFSYRTIMGRDPGVTLLVLLLFLKLLETRAGRDVFVVAFLVYFVALANFFYSQSIPIAGLMLLTVLVTTTALVGFSAPQRPFVDDLKTAGRMLAQAGPVMLLLFFLFPRVQGPLWGMPQDAYSGVTGLSETMSPGSISSLTPIRSRIRYEMRSFPEFRAASGGNPEDLALALRIPRGVNPRSLALASEWRDSLADNSAVVRRAIEFFRGSRFEYTLQPPALGQNSVDEFLFDTKQGFCEHFASSFVFLMRAAGVPARVVTGYQGGDTNPVDGYMVVSQADAHAWAEVWLAGNGWTRVDPTAAAVPVRVELGITAAAPGGATLPLLIRANLNWLKGLRNNWEALTNQWNQWVLGYNPDRQREMLSWLGVPQPSWQTMTVMLFWSVAGVLLLTALWLLRGIRREDTVQRAWLRFCDKLAREGLARACAEGPLDYADRAARVLPARENAVRAIASLYVDQRYGPGPDARSIARLTRLVREFAP